MSSRSSADRAIFRPSLFRIISRDQVSRAAAGFFVLGAIALCTMIYSSIHPRVDDSRDDLRETVRVLRGERVENDENPSDSDMPWLYPILILFLAGLPLRVLMMRVFFSRSEEVEGTIEGISTLTIIPVRTMTVITYKYTYKDERFEGKHFDSASMWRHYSEHLGAKVDVLVDPIHPTRSILREAWDSGLVQE